MAWPTKTDFVDGDVLTAAQVNNIGTNLNVFNPTSATNGHVLTANGSGSASYSALPAAGGWTSLASGNLNGLSSLDLTSITQTYKNIHLILTDWSTSAAAIIYFRFNNLTSSSYSGYVWGSNGTGTSNVTRTYGSAVQAELTHTATEASGVDNFTHLWCANYTNTTANKVFGFETKYQFSGNHAQAGGLLTSTQATTAVDRVTVYPASGTFDLGTYILYGEN